MAGHRIFGMTLGLCCGLYGAAAFAQEATTHAATTGAGGTADSAPPSTVDLLPKGRGAGWTEVPALLRALNERGQDTAEPVCTAWLSAMSIMTVQPLRTISFGLLAGRGPPQKMGGGLTLRTAFGFGSHQSWAEPHARDGATRDPAVAAGGDGLRSLSRPDPSAILPIRLRQSLGEGHSLSVTLTAGADHRAALAFAGDGPATLSITTRQGMTVGFSLRWQF